MATIISDEVQSIIDEYFDIMNQFEKNNKYLRFDREPVEKWTQGIVYEDGESNNLFQQFMAGYMYGKYVRADYQREL